MQHIVRHTMWQTVLKELSKCSNVATNKTDLILTYTALFTECFNYLNSTVTAVTGGCQICLWALVNALSLKLQAFIERTITFTVFVWVWSVCAHAALTAAGTLSSAALSGKWPGHGGGGGLGDSGGWGGKGGEVCERVSGGGKGEWRVTEKGNGMWSIKANSRSMLFMLNIHMH